MVESIEQNYSMADFRKRLKLTPDTKFQIKFYLEDENVYKWFNCKIVEFETGETHKFYENEGDEDFQECPIFVIEDEDGEQRNICFLSDQLVYSCDYDFVNVWRKAGSKFDMSEKAMKALLGEESDDDDDDEDYEDSGREDTEYDEEDDWIDSFDFEFSSEKDIYNNMFKLTGAIYTRVLKEHGHKLKHLKHKELKDYETAYLLLREEQTKLLTEYFVNQTKVNEKDVPTVKDLSISRDQIFDIMQKAYANVKTRISDFNYDLMKDSLGYYV